MTITFGYTIWSHGYRSNLLPGAVNFPFIVTAVFACHGVMGYMRIPLHRHFRYTGPQDQNLSSEGNRPRRQCVSVHTPQVDTAAQLITHPSQCLARGLTPHCPDLLSITRHFAQFPISPFQSAPVDHICMVIWSTGEGGIRKHFPLQQPERS